MLWKLLSRGERSRFASVVVSMTSRGELGSRIEGLGVPVRALGMTPGISTLVGLGRLIRLLRAERPHVLQTWLYHADLLGLIAGKVAGVPAIAWNVRCAELEKKDHPLHLWWTLNVLARASGLPDAVVVNSAAGRLASERSGYRPKRWQLIPNGFELDVFRPSGDARLAIRKELGVAAESVLIGLVARYDPMKDHGTFLRAAGTLHKVRPDVHFVLAGRGVDWQNTALKEEIATLDLDGCVHLLGERADIAVVTAALDIASCSSYSEGFPNVVGEAMACGVPCVATNVGDCASILGDAGVVVPARDPGAMAGAWERLLAMEEDERRAVGVKGRARIGSHYGIDQVVRQYEALYGELAGASRDREPGGRHPASPEGKG